MNHACARCGAATTNAGRCRACARPENQRKAARPNYREVYKTDRWRTLRAAVLKRDHGVCQKCRRAGTTVGHRRAFHGASDPQAYDPSNVECQCLKCNGREAGLRHAASRQATHA